MDAHINEWLSLTIRWIHFIVGVAWIGASFYFNFLENRLERGVSQKQGIEGQLWAIHGGGFYFLEKYKVAPAQLPEHLHWFKYEAYFTWITGFLLLWVVYYFNARAYMIDPRVAAIGPTTAVFIGLGSLAGSWLIYDQLCKRLGDKPMLLATVLYLFLVALAFLLCQLFSGRAAFIHVGAAIGTMMVANVFFVIIPAQKELVAAMQEGREPDGRFGANALLRSRHNNYLTLPVLFIMISNHYPSTFGGQWNWAILAALMAIGALVRHYFNIRHLPGTKGWILPSAAAGVIVLAILTSPALRQSAQTDTEQVAFQEVRTVIQKRCTGCHAAAPTFQGFTTPPAGVILETDEQIEQLAARIHAFAVVSKTMPIGNLTQMTEAERQLLDRWFIQGGKTD